MKKWSNQNYEEQQRKFIDFDTKRKTNNQNKLENDPESSTILRNANRNDQQQSQYPLYHQDKQNETLLKRVILLEQRTRDYDDLHILCQNLDRKVSELGRKCEQIYNWAKTQDEEQVTQSIVMQIQERIVELEETVKNVSTKPTNNFDEILQNDLNTLYDIIKCHESNNTDLLENQKQLKQELGELAVQLRTMTNYNSNTLNSRMSNLKMQMQPARQNVEDDDQDPSSQREKFESKFNSQEQMKKQKSVLSMQKNDINGSVEKPGGMNNQQRLFMSPVNSNGNGSNKRTKEIDQLYLMDRSTIHKDSDAGIQTREGPFESQWGGQPSTEKNQVWNNMNKNRKPEQNTQAQQQSKITFFQQPQLENNNTTTSNQRMQSFIKKKDSLQNPTQPMKSFKL